MTPKPARARQGDAGQRQRGRLSTPDRAVGWPIRVLMAPIAALGASGVQIDAPRRLFGSHRHPSRTLGAKGRRIGASGRLFGPHRHPLYCWVPKGHGWGGLVCYSDPIGTHCRVGCQRVSDRTGLPAIRTPSAPIANVGCQRVPDRAGLSAIRVLMAPIAALGARRAQIKASGRLFGPHRHPLWRWVPAGYR